MIDVRSVAESVERADGHRAAVRGAMAVHERHLREEEAAEAALPLCMALGLPVDALVREDRRWGSVSRRAALDALEHDLGQLRAAAIWPLRPAHEDLAPVDGLLKAIAALRRGEVTIERVRECAASAVTEAPRQRARADAARERHARVEAALRVPHPSELDAERPGAGALWKRLITQLDPIRGAMPPAHLIVRACPDLANKLCELADELPVERRGVFYPLQGLLEQFVEALGRGEVRSDLDWATATIESMNAIADEVAAARAAPRLRELVVKHQAHAAAARAEVRAEIEGAVTGKGPSGRRKSTRSAGA